jgi:uncharacterized protein with GYD domain
MLQVSYTPAAWAALIKKPQDRIAVVGKAVEKLGGKVGPFWMAFGEHDLIGVIEMPDNVSAAAFALAVSAGGACSKVITTPLLTVEEGIAAMKKAGGSGYKPVAKK